MGAVHLGTNFPHEERPRLGAILLRRGWLSPEQLEQALTAAAGTGARLGEVVVQFGWLTEENVAKALAEQFGLAFMDPGAAYPDPEAVALLPEELARRACVLPIRFLDPNTVVVAVADPTDSDALSAAQKAMGRQLSLVVAERSAIEYAMMHAHRGGAAPLKSEPDSEPKPPSRPELVRDPATGDLTTLVARLVVAVEDIASELRALRELHAQRA